MTTTAPPPSDRLDPQHAGRLMRRASQASVTVAAILVAAKLGAWLMTDSVAVLSTLIDSLLDAAASLVTLVAVRQALTPADEEHRFGHGKAEPLAGLGQSAFIAGSGALLLMQAIARLVEPAPVRDGMVGIAVMGLSIALTLLLVTFQRHVIRKTGSVAIGADSLHYTGDLLTNLAVIASLLVGMVVDIPRLDPLLALGIAAYLMANAWTIGVRSIHLLMDSELPDADRDHILDLCRRHPQVRDVHDLRTRSSGPLTFIQLHLELDAGQTLLSAHAVAVEVEAALHEAFPNADILIHQDPAGLRENNHPPFAYQDRVSAPSEPAPG
ncbi:cation diffusion facilitator family transporter [Pararhodospirillum oryzae]|uniref:Protein p34 n=1 Tax=Pararhodospirillum oryzae TaxID=478448 RepID=A0A512H791_9PROT|nr:cation diffusion facilitator family transporter [Pararhodospirillum oryzae]GEO81322.1 iron transporter [Pararhodospirillum oryzae]